MPFKKGNQYATKRTTATAATPAAVPAAPATNRITNKLIRLEKEKEVVVEKEQIIPVKPLLQLWVRGNVKVD